MYQNQYNNQQIAYDATASLKKKESSKIYMIFRIISAVFTVIAVGFLVTSGLFVSNFLGYLSLESEGVRTTAYVTDIRAKASTKVTVFESTTIYNTVIVKYEVNGKIYTDVASVEESVEIGDAVTAFYDKDNPSRMTVEGDVHIFPLIIAIVFGILGLVFFVAGVVMFILSVVLKKKRKNTGTMNYYPPVNNMDMNNRQGCYTKPDNEFNDNPVPWEK